MRAVSLCYVLLLIALVAPAFNGAMGQLPLSNIWNNWYFGDHAGLNFDAGMLNVDTTNSFATGVLSHRVSISDPLNGDLLFYSNGLEVKDRTHTQMPNGFLSNPGPGSKYHDGCIPHPGDSNIYYLFSITLDSLAIRYQLRYSVIDMSLNNGNGDIDPGTKLILLADSMNTMLAGGSSPTTGNHYLVTHKEGTNRFVRFDVTADSGLIVTPVEQDIGPAISGANFLEQDMYVAPNGSILGLGQSSGIHLYKIDSVTLQLYDEVFIPTPPIYSLAFSYNCKFLFTSISHSSFPTSDPHLYVYDIQTWDPISIQNSVFVLDPNGTPNVQRLGLVLSPIGDIIMDHYNAGDNYLSTIVDPDNGPSSSSFQLNSINTGRPNRWLPWTFWLQPNPLHVSITEGTANPETNFYPNPSNGLIYLSSPLAEILECRNPSGALVVFNQVDNTVILPHATGIVCIKYVEPSGAIRVEKVFIQK